MEREATLRSSLAAIVTLVLLFNTIVIHLASRGAPLIGAQEAIPIGFKWMLLAGSVVVGLAIAFWLHRLFLESGISPLDTTWVDFMVIAYAVATVIALLFIGQAFWMLYAIFLFALFVFSIIVVRKLLDNKAHWLGWIIGTLLLSALTVVFLTTVLPTS